MASKITNTVVNKNNMYIIYFENMRSVNYPIFSKCSKMNNLNS